MKKETEATFLLPAAIGIIVYLIGAPLRDTLLITACIFCVFRLAILYYEEEESPKTEKPSGAEDGHS